MSDETIKIWCVSPQRDLHPRYFDQETVIFDATSGDTHLLCTDAARLLDALASGPLTLAALQAAQPDIPAPDVLLRDLEKIGLVHTE
ncbi:MAG: HPr-rel-A system PqqD family peptide chaperone [Hydrogenophilales bacterium]|nr:HPr-rel-A system PqqD family peptide chaperone [Hydrogenophilales bacterium]